MKESHLFALLALLTLGLIAFSALDFYLTTLNSDCTYAPMEPCTSYARSQQHMIFWRAAAIELAAVLAFILIRKR